jgi:hypothetical protein
MKGDARCANLHGNNVLKTITLMSSNCHSVIGFYLLVLNRLGGNLVRGIRCSIDLHDLLIPETVCRELAWLEFVAENGTSIGRLEARLHELGRADELVELLRRGSRRSILRHFLGL